MFWILTAFAVERSPPSGTKCQRLQRRSTSGHCWPSTVNAS
ncbi:hypothetical protein [Calothrix sp. NIES-2100]